MSKLVNVEVMAEKHGNYKKGDTIEGMHSSTAKALGKVVKVVGDYEAPKKGNKVARAYIGNTKAQKKAAIKKGTEEIEAEEKEEAEVEAEIEAEEKAEKKSFIDKLKGK